MKINQNKTTDFLYLSEEAPLMFNHFRLFIIVYEYFFLFPHAALFSILSISSGLLNFYNYLRISLF